jgi:hypothetical protein
MNCRGSACADLFFFPTIEDGYAVVLAHARSAGLPIRHRALRGS